MSFTYVHALLDAKLKIWKTDVKTKDIKPFVIIKIVPFNDEWKAPRNYVAPLPITFKKKKITELKRYRVRNNRKTLVSSNYYEVLSDVTEELVWPEDNVACDVEIDEKAKPDNFVVVKKQFGSMRQNNYMIYNKKIQEGTVLIDRQAPNFDEAFPSIARTISVIEEKKPVVIWATDAIKNTIEFEGKTSHTTLRTHSNDNTMLFKTLDELSEKDKPVIITELETIRLMLANIASEDIRGYGLASMVADVSRFVSALYEKHCTHPTMRPLILREPNHKIKFKRGQGLKGTIKTNERKKEPVEMYYQVNVVLNNDDS